MIHLHYFESEAKAKLALAFVASFANAPSRRYFRVANGGTAYPLCFDKHLWHAENGTDGDPIFSVDMMIGAIRAWVRLQRKTKTPKKPKAPRIQSSGFGKGGKWGIGSR